MGRTGQPAQVPDGQGVVSPWGAMAFLGGVLLAGWASRPAPGWVVVAAGLTALCCVAGAGWSWRGHRARWRLALLAGSALGLAGWFNAPLGDYAAFRVYAAHRDRDGWMDVTTGAGPRTEDKDYDQDFNTFRGKLLIEPTDNVDIVISGDITRRDENCCTAVQLVSGGTAPIINALGGGNAIAIPADPWARQAYSNRSTAQKINDKGLQAEVNIDLAAFGGATLTSVTGGRDWDAVNGRDFDFSAADLIYMNPQEDESFNRFKTFSQEFRLAGSTDKVDWLFGMFYADEDLVRNDSITMAAPTSPTCRSRC